jgi:hypothetical protein
VTVLDFWMVGLIALTFAVLLAYTAACDRL